MKWYPRFGKPQFGDFGFGLIGFAGLLILSIVGLFLDFGMIRCCILTIISIAGIFLLIRPYCERFAIQESLILAYWPWNSTPVLRATNCISIPKNCVLILTRADVRVPFGYQSYYLKGKCALSILKPWPLPEILEKLHAYHAKAYTNTSIAESFHEAFVYSFACDEKILSQAFSQKPSILIVPESLAGQFYLSNPSCQVYIDSGF